MNETGTEADCERDHIDDSPEGLLWIRLWEYADAVAAELDTPPSVWMHQQVENYAKARRQARWDSLKVVPT